MSNPVARGPHTAKSQVLCGPVYVFAVVKVAYMLTTCPHFDNPKFDIFDAGCPQCHFITSVHCLIGAKLFVSFLILPLFH